VLCCIERGGEWARQVEDYCQTVVVMGKKPGVAWALPFRLARLFRAQCVDVVHCHNFAPFVYGSIAGRIAGCRGVVYTVHGPDVRSEKMQALFQRLPVVDEIVAVSEHVRRRAIEALGLDQSV